MRRLLVRLSVVLVIFFIFGEGLARTLDVVDRLNGYSRHIFARGSDPALPYVLRAGVVTTLFGMPIRVNHIGLRGRETSPAPRPGVRRILFLGDSIVFGVGVGEEEAVPAVLERHLNAALGAWEVLNAGVPGYDALAEARLLETAGIALHPSVIVVGTSLNDYDPAPAYSPLGILTRQEVRWQPGLADRSELVVLLRWLATWARGGLWQQMAAPALPAVSDALVQDLRLRFYRAPTPTEWERFHGALAALARIAHTHGLPLLVAIFPESYQVSGAKHDPTPQRRLLELCHETGLHCLDLQPAFAAAGDGLFLDPQHPSARGHAVAAAVISEELERGALVRGPG